MQYLLTFNQPTEVLELHDDPVRGPPALHAWTLYMTELSTAGALCSGNRLAPPWAATTVRVRGGERLVQDGPFADTKEMAAGYIVIEVASLDEALDWAARAPSSSTGSTEVRPVAPGPA